MPVGSMLALSYASLWVGSGEWIQLPGLGGAKPGSILGALDIRRRRSNACGQAAWFSSATFVFDFPATSD